MKIRMTRCRRSVLMMLVLAAAAAGLNCSGEQDPVLEVLAARADYAVELKGFTEKRGQWDETVGTLLSIFVINDSDVTLGQLTVRLRRFGPGNEEEALETRRLTLDVSDIVTNRSAEIIVEVPGFVPGSLDGLTVDLELLPPEAEYGEFPELADALAARQAAAAEK